MGKKDKSSKRKSREIEVATDGLRHKSLGDKDGNVIDDLSEPTMGEKLASLNLEQYDKPLNHDNADFSLRAKPPNADSVHILLKQALRADDRALLIDCLYRQDEKVITNSLSLLNPSDVLLLLQSLVPIIQLRGAVLACALPWLKNLLLQHAGSIMSQESSLAALNSIYQDGTLVLSERIGGGSANNLQTITFDYPTEHITRLEGCYVNDAESKNLCSITFHTNKRKYGPYGPGICINDFDLFIDYEDLRETGLDDFNYQIFTFNEATASLASRLSIQGPCPFQRDMTRWHCQNYTGTCLSGHRYG